MLPTIYGNRHSHRQKERHFLRMFAPSYLSNPNVWLRSIIVHICTLALQSSQHHLDSVGALCNKYDKQSIYSYLSAVVREVPKVLFKGENSHVSCRSTSTFQIRKLSLLPSNRGCSITPVRTLSPLVPGRYRSVERSELTHISTMSYMCICQNSLVSITTLPFSTILVMADIDHIYYIFFPVMARRCQEGFKPRLCLLSIMLQGC